MRVLLVARLSQVSEGQTGIESQDADARTWAEQHGHTVVGVAADKISGQKPPWERPNLRPWMTDPDRLRAYDAIVASKQDRLSRAKWRDESEIRRWAEDHGKQLFIVSPELHWPPGNMAEQITWDVLAAQAAQEWQNTSDRYVRMQSYLREHDFLVGRPPWGYLIQAKDGHKILIPDPKLRPYLVGMVERALAGESLAAIGRWLDAEGIAPRHGGLWSTSSVAQTLRNPILVGRRKGKNGKTVLRVDPVIDTKTWKRLQTVLGGNARPHRGVPAKDTSMLTNVLRCANCGCPMYRFRDRYYRCMGAPPKKLSTCHNAVWIDRLDQWVSETITGGGSFAGSTEIIERVVIPGSGHADELDQNAADIRELDPDDPHYDKQLTKLRAERARLQALPVEPDTITERPTGLTIAELWQRLDTQARRRFLIATGIEVLAMRYPTDEIEQPLFNRANALAAGAARISELPNGKGTLAALFLPTLLGEDRGLIIDAAEWATLARGTN